MPTRMRQRWDPLGNWRGVPPDPVRTRVRRSQDSAHSLRRRAWTAPSSIHLLGWLISRQVRPRSESCHDGPSRARSVRVGEQGAARRGVCARTAGLYPNCGSVPELWASNPKVARASLTLLRRAFAGYRLDARLRVRGTARLLVDYDGVLGPNRPDSDATLHPLALSRCDAVELTEQEWKVVRFGQAGEKTVLAFGARTGGETVEVALDRKPGGETSRVYSVGARAKEPQRRDERREESEGARAQT